ncbi:hypothetical protein, partial [Mycolicibacter arupensis]|uniref:hypothetical protein n=1 Tax=Mycolicibacter arupensis TaxID=342002 RepID=UPI0021F2C102
IISQKLTSKKRHTPNTGRQRHGKKQQQKISPNTLLSSQTTRLPGFRQPRHYTLELTLSQLRVFRGFQKEFQSCYLASGSPATILFG